MDISPHYMVMPGQIGASCPKTSTYVHIVHVSDSGDSYSAIRDGSYLVPSFTIAEPSTAAGRASRQTCVQAILRNFLPGRCGISLVGKKCNQDAK